MTSYSYDIKIPKSRIAVLIGKNGTVKKELEQETGTKLKIDSQEGDVVVCGEEPVNMLTARDIITAIGRGFNPEIAMLLLKQDYIFESIDISHYVNNKGHFERIKGRVIGQDGKARQTIEELTNCSISVFGKTVSIVGPVDFIVIAKKGVEMLLSGSPHSNVYRMLERKRKEMRHREYE